MSINGTSRIGTLSNIVYDQLYQILGNPTFTNDDKITVLWVIIYNNQLYTIYDYKSECDPYIQLKQWSIGGNAMTDINSFLEFLESELFNSIVDIKVEKYPTY